MINFRAISAIYKNEMMRFFTTLFQSIAAPIISTSLYFIVFGAALGSRIDNIDGIPYGLFIVPGVIMLSVLTHGITNAAFGIFFPKFTGTIYEILSAPISFYESLLAYVGAATTKSLILATIIIITASFFVDLVILHPFWMVLFLLLTSVSFALLGFIIGLWADNFEKLQLVPMLIITPLVFLGGSFYSINMLPPFWHTLSLLNPVLYLISGFRWSFYGVSDVDPVVSLSIIVVFMIICISIISWIFKTGYKLKS